MDENQLSKVVADCCYRIHKKLGPELLESVYPVASDILNRHFFLCGLAALREMSLPLLFPFPFDERENFRLAEKNER
jgi:hypothetical protein